MVILCPPCMHVGRECCCEVSCELLDSRQRIRSGEGLAVGGQGSQGRAFMRCERVQSQGLGPSYAWLLVWLQCLDCPVLPAWGPHTVR